MSTTDRTDRRTMMKRTLAAVAGLAAAPAALAAAYKPAAQGPRRTAGQEAAHEEEYGLVLAAVYEAVEALGAVGRRLEGSGCYLEDDAAGMLFHVAVYRAMFEGAAPGGLEGAARAEQARRRPHADPIYRVELALGGLKTAVSEVLDRHSGCDGCFLCDDCQGVKYQVEMYESLWAGSCRAHLSDGAKQEQFQQLVRDYEAGKLPASPDAN